MRITLVSATSLEIEETLKYFGDWNQLKNIEIEHLLTGIGMVATCFTLTKYLQKKRPDLMIQAGIAGCFDKKTPLGTTFLVKNELIADMGVYENHIWKDAFEMGFIQQNMEPWQDQMLQNKNIPFPEFLNIQSVNGVSVNQISTDHNFIKTMINRYNATVESMEGAAFHYACLQEHISFIQFRSASNYVGERNKQNWQFRESMNNLNHTLINYISQIIKTST